MYGKLTGPLLGLAMREIVRRALDAIRTKRFVFEAEGKMGLGGEMNDFVTSADKEAQVIYTEALRKYFPTYGIVAEEEGLRIESSDRDFDLTFTVDPLDGTKAFMRKQSEGIGTMLSLVENGTRVIAAYVGDIMTKEIYGFRPDSEAKVYRIDGQVGKAERLTVDVNRPLRDQYLLLREAPRKFLWAENELFEGEENGSGAFRDIQVIGGSIGIGMARLWKGEVGGVLMMPSAQTPWDICPVVGISEAMGFVFLEFDKKEHCLRRPEESMVTLEVRKNNKPVLVVHESRLQELAYHTLILGQIKRAA